jgi:hypothetical protein
MHGNWLDRRAVILSWLLKRNWFCSTLAWLKYGTMEFSYFMKRVSVFWTTERLLAAAKYFLGTDKELKNSVKLITLHATARNISEIISTCTKFVLNLGWNHKATRENAFLNPLLLDQIISQEIAFCRNFIGRKSFICNIKSSINTDLTFIMHLDSVFYIAVLWYQI